MTATLCSDLAMYHLISNPWLLNKRKKFLRRETSRVILAACAGPLVKI